MTHDIFSGLQRVDLVSINDQLLYEENVFLKDGKRFVFAGTRKVAAIVIGVGIPGYYIIEIIRSKGVNPFPQGVRIEKPLHNLRRAFSINHLQGKIELQAGGHLEGVDANGNKVVTDSADRGGMSVGAKHTEGGIQGDVQDKRIEFENREPVITSEVQNDTAIDTFEGKKMSAKEVLSEINVDNGGKAFAEGGDTGTDENPVKFKGNEYILTAPVSSNPKKYNYNGKQMTGLEIASSVNKRNNGLEIASDGMQTCACNK